MAGKKAFAVAWPSEQQEEQPVTGEPPVALAPVPSAKKAPPRPRAVRKAKPQHDEEAKSKPARKRAAQVPTEAGHLAKLAKDPVTFVKLSPRPPQGEGEAPLNVLLPAEDLVWLRSFSAKQGLSQKELVRAFVKAMRADFGE